MSFWGNKEEYKVSLVEFVERFVGHNSCVKLYTQELVEKEQGRRCFHYTLIWKGMDWQITEPYSGRDYFKRHKEVSPCPYSEYNVVKLTSAGINGQFADEVSLVVEEL